MAEAADRGDLYSSFMNLLSLQDMLYEITEGIKIGDFEIMDKFDPQDLENNVCVFNTALSNYLAEYEKWGYVQCVTETWKNLRKIIVKQFTII